MYLLKRRNPAIIFIEIKINGQSEEGLLFIKEALREKPDLVLIAVSSEDESKVIDRTLNLGAIDFLVKHHNSKDQIEAYIPHVIKWVETEVRLTANVAANGGLLFGPDQMIVGKSQAMLPIYRLIQKVTDDKSSVLVLGGSGTGKELIAKAIHAGKGGQLPFVSIDCGCIQKTLLESELFGVRENYPGMHNKEKLVGQLETAGAGTLLLDEVGNMPVDLQASLLRVLQEREFRPLGAEKPIPLHAQVVATTNLNLDNAIGSGQFREDLYFRLNAVRIVLPDLKQRQEDIPLLVRYYLKQHESRVGFKVEVLPEAMDKLIKYDWPGNVRELFQTLQRTLTTHRSRYLAPRHFDLCLTPSESGYLRRKVSDYEKELLEKALDQSGWNQSQAAKKLHISRSGLIREMKKHGLRKERSGTELPS